MKSVDVNINEDNIGNIEEIRSYLITMNKEINKKLIYFLDSILDLWMEVEGGKEEEDFNNSGSKYLRKIMGAVNNQIDVYSVLKSFEVTCPARQHAIKKLLCSGLRNKGTTLQDLTEAMDAIKRAIQLEQ